MAIQVDRKVHVNMGTATVRKKEDESVIEIMERTAMVDAITAATQLSTAGMTAPFTYRTR